MKKIVIILAMALIFATGASASASDDEAVNNACRSISKLAAKIMEGRQIGVPMADMMEHAEETFTFNMIRGAYKEPRFQTPKYQQRAIVEFQNKWYAACLDALDL